MHGEHIMIHLLKYLLYCISNGQETKRMLFTTKRGIWQLVSVLSVLLRLTDSDYPFGIYKFFFCPNVLSVLLRFTDSDYPFGFYKLDT
jgi:hypothetical protein